MKMSILKMLNNYCEITNNTFVNAACYYIIVVACWEIVATVVNFALMLIKWIIVSILSRIAAKNFGVKTFHYKWHILAFMKLYVDVIGLLRCLYIPHKIHFSYECDKSPSSVIRLFSFENLFQLVFGIVNKLVAITPINVCACVISIYLFLGEYILLFLGKILTVQISIENGVSIINIVMFSLLLLFALTDLSPKMDAYSLIRKKHYEEVMENESKLLDALNRIHGALINNIDQIIKKKSIILQYGVRELCGKNCWLDNGKLVFGNENYGPFSVDDLFGEFRGLEEAFDELDEIVNKLNSFGASDSYLFKTYDKDFRLRFFISEAAQDSFEEYEKHRCFSRDNMIQWYLNWFLKYKDREYKDKELLDHIKDASLALDYMLLDSWERELEYRHCIMRLEKKFAKLNRYSRFKLRFIA